MQKSSGRCMNFIHEQLQGVKFWWRIIKKRHIYTVVYIVPTTSIFIPNLKYLICWQIYFLMKILSQISYSIYTVINRRKLTVK